MDVVCLMSAGGAPRIFVAEDEFLVAVLLEQDLQSAGYEVAGPFTRLPEAIAAAERETLDLALLDMNMNGQMAYPVADCFLARGTPLLLLSGYGAMDLPERLRGVPRVSKPYDKATLLREIERLLPRQRAAPASQDRN